MEQPVTKEQGTPRTGDRASTPKAKPTKTPTPITLPTPKEDNE